jgi:hypothetical protein
MRLRSPSGSLSQFTAQKKGTTYPAVPGDRDPQNIDHWYWQFTYKERSDDGQLRSRAVAVRRGDVPTVRSMILHHSSIAEILTFLGK